MAEKSKQKLVSDRKYYENTDMFESEWLAVINLILQKVLPSERQVAELGVYALKAPLGVLHLPRCRYYEYLRPVCQFNTHLSNMRSILVLSSQISTVYSKVETIFKPRR